MADEARTGRIWRVLLVVGGLLGLAVFLILADLQPMAPRRVDLLTGPKGSSYFARGEAMARALRAKGITARVVETSGALDNLRRLLASETPALALAQSNLERALDDPAGLEKLVTLGSLAFEPLWIFVRDGMGVADVRELAGMTVAMGPVGSGSHTIGKLLLQTSGMEVKVTVVPVDDLAGPSMVEGLRSGRLDAVFLVGGSQTAAVAQLLHADAATPLSLTRASTYAVLVPGLAPFAVPPGVADFAADIPDAAIETLTATTSMVVLKDMHPALTEALIDAAGSSQPRPTLEAPDGEFPSSKHVSLPLDPRARRFYTQGPSKLSRVLPYWASALVDQFVFVLLPALAVLFTVLKAVPMLLGAQFSLGSLALTRRMMAIERDLLAGKDAGQLRAALDKVDRESSSMRAPPSKSSKYLELRQNLHDIRERLDSREKE